MGVFVKICGISNAEDCAAVVAMRPDAIGFVFWPPSPRVVQPEDVAAWTRDLPRSLLKVGVFVDEPPEKVTDVLDRAGLDVAQLHGRESPEVCEQVSGSVWKAVHLDRTGPKEASGYPVDAFLVDSYSSASPGGTGQVADWNLARKFVQNTPVHVLLAGGLTQDNVGDAISRVQPWGVDVSSGVEAEPGKKDHAKVRRFIEACRS